MTTATMLMATMVVLGPQFGDSPAPAPRGGVIEVTNAVVVAKEDLPVPALDAGLIADLLIGEGSVITKGQLLAKQDDADLRAQRRARAAELDVALAQAESDLEELAALETAQTAKVEYEESLEINLQEPGAVPETQVRRQKLQYNRARLQAIVARQERRIAIMQTHVKAAEVDAIDIAIRRREIKSPIDGVVIQVSKRRGEWLQPGDVLLRVLRMDLLRVEGLMKLSDAAPHEVEGRPVLVKVLARGQIVEAQGVIVFANPVLTGPGDNLDFRVIVEIKNKPHPTLENVWQINPGMPATIVLDPNAPRAPAPAAPVQPEFEAPGIQPPAPAAPPIDVLPGGLGN